MPSQEMAKKGPIFESGYPIYLVPYIESDPPLYGAGRPVIFKITRKVHRFQNLESANFGPEKGQDLGLLNQISGSEKSEKSAIFQDPDLARDLQRPPNTCDPCADSGKFLKFSEPDEILRCRCWKSWKISENFRNFHSGFCCLLSVICVIFIKKWRKLRIVGA